MRGNLKYVVIIFSVSIGLTLLLLLLLSHSPTAFVDPVTLYVALDGDDANTCASDTERCATVQRAVDVAQPGDEIRVAMGTYTDISTRVGITQVVYISKTIFLQGGYSTDDWDTPNPTANPTTLHAQELGRVMVIRDAGPTIQGFVLTGGAGFFSGGGINIENASPVIYNNQIIGNSADGDGGGIWVNRGSAEIINNRIISNTAVWAGGLRIINNAEVNIVGNQIVGNGAQISAGGIDLECCEETVSFIAGNFIANNNGGTAGGGVSVKTTYARLVNNILIGNQANNGAGIWLGGAATHPVSTTLHHNTFVGDLTKEDEAVWSGEYVTVTLVNNILVDFGTGITNTVPASSSVTADYTLFYNNYIDYGPGVNSTNEVHGDPSFINPAVEDYHIGPASAALDMGVNAGAAEDFDGEPRPYGPGFDIGADEIVEHIFLPLIMRLDQP